MHLNCSCTYLNRLTLDFFFSRQFFVWDHWIHSQIWLEVDLGLFLRYVISTLSWKFQPKYCALRNRFVLQVEVLLFSFVCCCFFVCCLLTFGWIYSKKDRTVALYWFFVCIEYDGSLILLLKCSHFFNGYILVYHTH